MMAMVTYEITADVDPALAADYESWMRAHIADVLATGCFTGATFERSGTGQYRIRYRAKDRATLDRYLSEHAPALREDFARHFPTGVTNAREVWEDV